VLIIGVDINDAPTDALAAMQGWQWTHESIWDPQGQVGYSLPRHEGVPITFFLDEQHRVVDSILSTASYDQLYLGTVRITGRR
jgi:hypothetical protein